jgi:hypothetical protein
VPLFVGRKTDASENTPAHSGLEQGQPFSLVLFLFCIHEHEPLARIGGPDDGMDGQALSLLP